MAVETLFEEYKNAWFRQDTDAYIALHAHDTEWINAYARMFQDADSLADFIEYRLFPAFDSSTSREDIRNMQTITIRYLEDEALRRTHVVALSNVIAGPLSSQCDRTVLGRQMRSNLAAGLSL